jgi:autotransporter-associated beta strand protein
VSGDNTWTGAIDTFGSGLYARISSDTNLLILANTITGSDPATSVVLQGAGNILVSGKITGPSGVFSGSVGAGTRTLSNMANDFSGNLNISGGTLKLGASGVIPDGIGNGNVVFSATATTSATFDLNGYSETINGLSSTVNGIVDNKAASATVTLTVGGNDQSSSYVGVIRNTGGTLALTKIGSGILILTGTNTYTGNTLVNAGTLELGVASIARNSTVSVADGAVLQLDFAEINVVAGFVTNGVSLSVGVYSAANVAPFIAGPGSLEVAPPQPVIAPVTVSGTNLVVSTPTVSPYNYVLQSTTNLTPTIHWKNESTNPGTGGNLIFNVPIEPGKPQKFLRFWVY